MTPASIDRRSEGRNAEKLKLLDRDLLESRPDVLGGEPVLKGTRLSIRYVSDLVAQGATHDELGEDFD